MPDPLSLGAVILGGILLLAGIAAQLRTHRIRRQWTAAGLGLEERATGLASLSAIPVIFPAELETARLTDTQLAVIVMRRFTEHPEAFGSRLAAATRAHETGWRLDYDLFAVTAVVDDREQAILAAARLAAAACGDGPARDLRIGVALCPDDGVELFDACDVALRRMRGYGLLAAVAGELHAQRFTAEADPADAIAG